MFQRTILRGVGVTGLVALNSDVDPSTLTGGPAAVYQTASNAMPVTQAGGVDTRVPQRFGVGAVYTGGGSPSATTGGLYVYEPLAGIWFPIQVGFTVTYGQITWAPIPSPQKGGVYAFVPSTGGGPTAGTYAYFVGFDYASVSGAAAGSSTAGLATQTTLAAVKADLDTLLLVVPPARGTTTPANSFGVTGSLSTVALVSVADAASGARVQLGALAAGPSGIRVTNTGADGAGNIRVGDANTSATQGTQLRPGVWEVFPVSNANLLWIAAEAGGTPNFGVNQA